MTEELAEKFYCEELFSERDLLEKKYKQLEQENAELKAKLKGFENGEVAWQGDMDATIKQNLELKHKLDAISAYIESEEFMYAGEFLVVPTRRIKRIIGA